MNKKLLKNGLIAAGLMNIGGVLVFSRAFTSEAVNNADPVVMSNFGLLMIVVWGLAYLGAASIKSDIKWLLGAFAIEKFVYATVWAQWLLQNDLSSLYSSDLLAGVFYSIYGINDFAFGLFFAWAFIVLRREST